MPTLDYQGTPLPVSDEGFLAEPEAWTREIAAFLARAQEGVETLGSEHWKVIDYIRGFWLEHDRPPLVRYVCKHTGLKLKRIYELFPSGPANGACKVAGLPNADGCV